MPISTVPIFNVTAAQPTVSIHEKVKFLSNAVAYPEQLVQIEVKETHMSWIFIQEQFVYKLKKPVCYPFLDFSTMEARRRDCEREVDLNRRLAPDVYLGTVALRQRDDGTLTLQAEGQVVDWLVKMRRLPTARILEVAIEEHTVTTDDIRRFSNVLIDFYKYTASPVSMKPQDYRHRFEIDIVANDQDLRKQEFNLPVSELNRLYESQRRFLHEQGVLLEQRAAEGHLVEGHGDLRPEHIFLLPQPVIIDCLEFNRDLRILDPVDELAYLAVECERLGDAGIGTIVLQQYFKGSSDEVNTALLNFYRLFRACLRARIALWHTEDHAVQDQDKWRKRAQQYLSLAEKFATHLDTR